jgi:hypothetical protein
MNNTNENTWNANPATMIHTPKSLSICLFAVDVKTPPVACNTSEMIKVSFLAIFECTLSSY